ncbi:MAG: DUF4038 domain-containing protein [Cyclobacteriaceae bacterium]|nr:DUF4038 domain-containing protein [Cyclobacteriaceae bacterium]
MKKLLLFCGLSILAISPLFSQQLRVSDNNRFLVYPDGKPFFWLGDTAWELFHRLTREEADLSLKNRAEKGFTVIQAVALAELDGLHDPNPYGRFPWKMTTQQNRGKRIFSTSIISFTRPISLGCILDCCLHGAIKSLPIVGRWSPDIQ